MNQIKIDKWTRSFDTFAKKHKAKKKLLSLQHDNFRNTYEKKLSAIYTSQIIFQNS